MLFQDMSCEAPHTVESHRQHGVYSMLEADWAGIVTITRSLAVQIDAYIDLSGTCDAFARAFIQNNSEQILTTDFSNTTFCTYVCGKGHVIVSFDRETDNYRVVSICCKQQGHFREESIQWYEIYTAATYRNVLLNNELIQERDYLDNVLESCESSIIVFAKNGDIVSFNRLAEQTFGVGLENLDFLWDGNQGDLRPDIHRVLETREKLSFDSLHLLKTDRSRIYHASLAPLRNSKNAVAGAVLVCSDHTEQENMQQEVALLKQYALLGEIALGLAHDIKNPLMNIRGCAGLMRNWSHSGQKEYEFCDIIDHEVERISKVIDQMMAFGNMAKADQTRLVDLNKVLYDCIQVLERQKAEKNITFRYYPAEDIPLLHARVIDLQQIFLNVMLNSMQAIEVQGEIQIEIHNHDRSRQIQIMILDDGSGIPDTVIDKVFDPYFSTKRTGTGLGLFVVRRALARYGGEICFHQRRPRGSICHITLPYTEENRNGGRYVPDFDC